MLLLNVGATLPVRVLQPRVLLSPLVPLTPLLPTSFPAPLQPLLFFDLLVFLLPDVAITGDCHIYPDHLLIPLVDHHDIQLVSHHHLISLVLEVHRILAFH